MSYDERFGLHKINQESASSLNHLYEHRMSSRPPTYPTSSLVFLSAITPSCWFHIVTAVIVGVLAGLLAGMHSMAL
jgi:hypothetical protein